MIMSAFHKSLLLMLILLLALPVMVWCDGSKLAVGDIIGVTVDGEKEFSKPYQINKDGCITVSMIDAVKLLDLNCSDASVVISNALSKVLVNPQVNVSFIERAKMQVFVVGQVKKAGLIEIGAGDRVLQALAQAGYDDSADLGHVSIRRGDQVIDLDLQKYLKAEDLQVNMELQSGDTVVVQRSDSVGNVLVLGQVSKVGAIPLKRGMTFREAMGLTGGVTVAADTDKITIKHESATESLGVDYKRAMEGDPSADIALQPGDTVFVPEIETSFFTAMGGVGRPGQYPLKGKLTLSEAIGLAGGPMPGVGDMRKVQLVRSSGPDNKPGETLNIDVTKVMKNEADDPLVNRGDVVYVAIHKPKTNILQVLQSLIPLGWLFK